MSVDAILKEVQSLSAEEREELRERFNEQYPENDVEISDELKALLDERIAEDDATPGLGYTIEEVMAHLRGRKK